MRTRKFFLRNLGLSFLLLLFVFSFLACSNQLYSIGGTVTGLSGTLVLQNNGGNDLTLTANGTFNFSTLLQSGAAYSVTVLSNPDHQTCTVQNGAGSVTGPVVNISVSCISTDGYYTVGGTLTHLDSGHSVVLQNNGIDDLSLSADGIFTFATKIANGSTYSVTILTQPSGETCTVSNGSGTIENANVINVTVDCP